MLQIKTEIHGLSFSQVNIFGCYLPSHASIKSVLNEISDKRKKRNICDRSNFEVDRLGCKYGYTIYQLDIAFSNAILKEITGCKRSFSDIYHDIGVGILYFTEKQCRISGDDYPSLVQKQFIVDWFECVVGDYGHDKQKLRKISDNILRHVYSKGTRKINDKYSVLKPEAPRSSMAKYPDYIHSKSYVDEFDTKIWKISNSNCEMFDLVIAVVELCNRSFEFSEPLELFCHSCQKYFTAKRRPSLIMCPSCLNNQREEKKKSRRIDLKGWKRGKNGCCKGGCGSLDIGVDESDICKRCYRSKFQEGK
jgi:hypothetical protein